MTVVAKAEEKEVQAQGNRKQNPKAKEVETHQSQFGDNLTDLPESPPLLETDLHRFAFVVENEVT